MQIKDLLFNKNSLFYHLAVAILQKKVPVERVCPTPEGITIKALGRKIGLVRLYIEETEQIILRVDNEPKRFFNPQKNQLVYFPNKVEITSPDDLIRGFFFILLNDDVINPISI